MRPDGWGFPTHGDLARVLPGSVFCSVETCAQRLPRSVSLGRAPGPRTVVALLGQERAVWPRCGGTETGG